MVPALGGPSWLALGSVFPGPQSCGLGPAGVARGGCERPGLRAGLPLLPVCLTSPLQGLLL